MIRFCRNKHTIEKQEIQKKDIDNKKPHFLIFYTVPTINIFKKSSGIRKIYITSTQVTIIINNLTKISP